MPDSKISPSSKRFCGHSIHDMLHGWLERIKSERPNEYRQLSPEAREAYVRLRWNLRDLQSRLKKANPLSSQIAVFDKVYQYLSNLQRNWDQFRGDPANQWQALDEFTNGLINHSRNIHYGNGLTAWNETLEDLRNEMEAAIKEARSTIQDLKSSVANTKSRLQKSNEAIEKLGSDIQTQKSRFDLMLTQQTESFTRTEQSRAVQFNQSEQDRWTKFTDSQDVRKSDFDSIVTQIEVERKEAEKTVLQIIKQHQDEFEQAQGNREQKFETFISESGGQKTAVLETHRNDFESLTGELKSKSGETLGHIQGQLDKAKEVVGTIVTTSMSGNYKRVANRELWNGWIMRGVAMASFFFMGVMVVWAVHSMNMKDNGIDWSTFAIRLSLGFAFIIPGIYCATEASRHWNAEKTNRRLALELAAFTPFIVSLDESKKKEIVEKMTSEYFGRATAAVDDGDEKSNLKEVQLRGDQVLKIIEQVAKIIHPK